MAMHMNATTPGESHGVPAPVKHTVPGATVTPSGLPNHSHIPTTSAAASTYMQHQQNLHQQSYYQQHVQYQQQQCGLSDASKYSELEQLVQEMRPHVLQVLKTQFYYNCNAASNLRRGIKQIRELCKQLRSETVLLSKQKRPSDAEQIPTKRSKMESGPSLSPLPHQNTAPIDPSTASMEQYTLPVIGGSPAGWNFILVPSNAKKSSVI